jgi:S1-C subfamily serine protease
MQLPDVIDRVRPSVVQIRRIVPGQLPSGQTIGTGFIVVDTEHVVTALHVVEAVNLSAGESVHVALAAPNVDTPELKMRANFSQYEGKVVGTDKDQDLALIHVPQLNGPGFRVQFGPKLIEAKPVAAKLNTSPLREGVELAVSGYPLAEPSLITNVGILASTFTLNNNPAQMCYLGDFTANPGNSGGPVYTTRDGSVIGVCVAGKLAPIIGGVGAQTTGLTVIVPAAQVEALLSANGLQQSTTVAATPRPNNMRKRRK